MGSTTTVFLSGSRTIWQLDHNIQDRLQNIADKRFDIVIGDAQGADTALQSQLAWQGYRNVTVYVSGDRCRNNIGDWQTHHVPVDPCLTGRAFYTAKDLEMAEVADYGLIVWDGRSGGSIANARELLKRRKMMRIYLTQTARFISIKGAHDLESVLRC